MKHINQFILLVIALCIGFAACQKADDLPLYNEGSAPQLSASTAVVNPPPADSNKVVLTLNWTDPGHAQDKSLYKYYLELDASGRNFSKATILNVTVDKDKRTYAFVAKELNSILLSYGFDFNVAYDIDIRLVSSYGNNNDQKKSNIVKIKATPYKIPPKVTLPSSGSLYIVGAATQGDWNNPVPVPTQEFQQIDETTYGGIFQINGGQEYLLLPVNGSWDTKYAIADNLAPGVADAGSFFFSNGPGNNFKAPANSGLYKITVDFQRGTYKVEPFTQQHGLPTDLFIVGNATPGDWVNPVPVPSQQLTRRNSVLWDINLNFRANGEYLILPTNGAWDRKYGADDPLATNARSGGKIKPEGANFPGPTNAGSYKFSINLYTGTYSVSPQ